MLYMNLKDIMKQGCSKFPKYILYYTKNEVNKKKNYLYELFFENFKNIEVICNNIDIIAYSQAGSTLRNTIEQVSVLKVLIEHEELLQEYSKFAKVKVGLINGVLEAEEEANNLFKNKTCKNVGFINYIDFGWLEKLGETEISVERIIKLSGFSDLIGWRKYCNNFVHNSISFIQYNQEGIRFYIQNFIYIAAILYDHLICMFHNMTNFDFNIEGINYANNYIEIFQFLTNRRKKET